MSAAESKNLPRIVEFPTTQLCLSGIHHNPNRASAQQRSANTVKFLQIFERAQFTSPLPAALGERTNAQKPGRSATAPSPYRDDGR
jgi:hypothetical protein